MWTYWLRNSRRVYETFDSCPSFRITEYREPRERVKVYLGRQTEAVRAGLRLGGLEPFSFAARPCEVPCQEH